MRRKCEKVMKRRLFNAGKEGEARGGAGKAFQNR